MTKAAIFRELKMINSKNEDLSNFSSPCHRIFDLEISANDSIRNNDLVSALEKLTEIYDDISERKIEIFYRNVLKRIEISSILLLLLLNLPPTRHSPTHIKLLERYSFDCHLYKSNFLLPDRIVLQFQGLVAACQLNNVREINEFRNKISKFNFLTVEHKILLQELKK